MRHKTLLFALILMVAKGASQDALTGVETTELISNAFSKIHTGHAADNQGTFGSLDLTKTEAIVTSSFSIGKGGDILTAKFKGGVTDGLAAVFNNSKLNTNQSLEVLYHMLISDRPSIGYYHTDLMKKRQSELKAELDYFDHLYTYLQTKGLLGAVERALKIRRDAIQVEGPFSAKIIEIKLVNEALRNHVDNNLPGAILPAWFELRMLEGNKKAEALRQNDKAIKPSQFHLTWMSVGINARNDEFRLFDTDAPFEDAIRKEQKLGYGFSLQISSYRFSENDNNWYWALVANHQHKSNYLDLKKMDVTETVTRGTGDNVTRETSKKYTVYSGDYISDVGETTLNADYFYFYKNAHFVGLHAFSNAAFSEKKKPIYNLGFGLVVPFKDKQNKDTIVNAELYYTIKNLMGIDDNRYSVLERNEIGFRFTFPFQFNTF